MEAHILLADAAQATPEGKVHALGLGWSTTAVPLPGHALVIFVKVPWDQTNKKHKLAVELVDADGNPVTVPGQVGVQPIRLEGDFEAGRPPGAPVGAPLDMALAFNINQGMPLEPGRYTWALSINEDTQDAWRATFTVRAGTQPSP